MLRQRLRIGTSPFVLLGRIVLVLAALALVWYGAMLVLLAFKVSPQWIGFGFGDAILCLLGAAASYAVVSFLEGDLDLTDLQGRVHGDVRRRYSPHEGVYRVDAEDGTKRRW